MPLKEQLVLKTTTFQSLQILTLVPRLQSLYLAKTITVTSSITDNSSFYGFLIQSAPLVRTIAHVNYSDDVMFFGTNSQYSIPPGE